MSHQLTEKKKYVPDPKHVLEDDNLNFASQEEILAELALILWTEEKRLRNKTIRKILAQWKGYPLEELLGRI